MSAFEDYLRRHCRWSFETFGQGRQTNSLTSHIEKELSEIKANPDDLSEWIDVIILALDGYLRHGGSPDSVLRDLQAKQDRNFRRQWLATGDENKPVEHDRSLDGP